jgi:gamma-glutamylcyclotransferase (GGCT)/AIG2-like uncharacterized protein YtfP
MTPLLFVYGTLLPGQPQWSLLSRYVTDHGWEAAVRGRLFDTGLGYPVADLKEHTDPTHIVHGRCVYLLEATAQMALDALDRYEDVHLGLYERLEVTTSVGQAAWSYSLGAAADQHFARLELIPSGDWAHHLRTQQQ